MRGLSSAFNMISLHSKPPSVMELQFHPTRVWAFYQSGNGRVRYSLAS